LELEELQNKKEELDGNTEKLSKENKDLLNKMEVMNQELERVKTEGQEQAKQDVMYLFIFTSIIFF
jgi:prefoldin subunit 5